MNWRKVKDTVAGKSMHVAVVFANSIVLLIILGLLIQSRPILVKKPILDLLLSSSWHPLKGEFGFYPFIVGTLEVTAIAMVLAVPVCLLSAIYLLNMPIAVSGDLRMWSLMSWPPFPLSSMDSGE